MEGNSTKKQPNPENSEVQGRERVSPTASGIEKRKPQKVESINTRERRLIYEKEFIFGGAPHKGRVEVDEHKRTRKSC